LLSTAGDDDMATLLGLMHTAKLEDLELKNSVLKVIHSYQCFLTYFLKIKLLLEFITYIT
jgi:hypothetical protein